MRPIELIPESIDVTNNGPESLHLPFGVVIAPGATATVNLFKYTGGPATGAGRNTGGTSNEPAALDAQSISATVVGAAEPGATAGIPIGAGAPRSTGDTGGSLSSANSGPVHIHGDSPRQKLWNAIVAAAQDGLEADKFVSVVAVAARGTAQVPGDILTAVGGTIDTAAATFEVATTEVATVVPTAGGSGYAIGNTLTADGGTGTGATFTVATTLVATVAVTDGGTGYAVGNVLTVVGGTGTAATITVATVTPITGVIETVTITTRGSYTVSPGLVNAVTGGAGTLASLTLTMGVATVTLATRGDYTVNPTLANSPTGGAGTGATVLLVMGAKTVTIVDAGDYVTAPTNPVATTSDGAGLACTLTLSFVSKIVTLTNQVVGAGQPNIAVGNSGGYFDADLDYQTPWQKRAQAVDTGVRTVNGTVGFNAAPRGGAAVVGIIPR
jgi:hypothetical protein